MEIGLIRRFTEIDWYAYAGAEKFKSGTEPFICEGKYDDGELIIIADRSGVCIQIFGNEMFELDKEEGGYKEIEEITYCWDSPEGLSALRAIGYMSNARRIVESSDDITDLIYKLEINPDFKCMD